MIESDRSVKNQFRCLKKFRDTLAINPRHPKTIARKSYSALLPVIKIKNRVFGCAAGPAKGFARLDPIVHNLTFSVQHLPSGDFHGNLAFGGDFGEKRKATIPAVSSSEKKRRLFDKEQRAVIAKDEARLSPCNGLNAFSKTPKGPCRRLRGKRVQKRRCCHNRP